MFGVDSGELLIIALIALLVIGPKELPRAMRAMGQFMGRARGMARHFRAGFDTMMREAELEEMEKKWKEENERIMRGHPPTPAAEAEWAPDAAESPAPTPAAQPRRPRPKAPPTEGASVASGPAAPPAPPAPPSDELP